VKNVLAYIRWENVVGLANSTPLTFNSRQERLHELGGGDALWLVSRNPVTSQYHFVARLQIVRCFENPPQSPSAEMFGPFAVEAEPSGSRFFGERFPADAVLRALLFDTGRPIKHGANIGHSLQRIRIAAPIDDIILSAALKQAESQAGAIRDRPFGLWTKCAPEFADYFLTNWNASHRPLAFLLYDSPPSLQDGAPVFVHSDAKLAFFARFMGAAIVSGYRHTADSEERLEERSRVWTQFREGTLKAPSLEAFADFWEAQDGVRSLFLLRDIVPAEQPVSWKSYGRALEWGFPNGVGYRYLTFGESMMLSKAVGLEPSVVSTFADLFLAQ
jgi:hypothetical protein